MTKGSYVSRSVYQKLKEENKRLLNDIRLLVQEGFPSADKIITIAKWRKKFAEDRELFEMLKEIFATKPDTK